MNKHLEKTLENALDIAVKSKTRPCACDTGRGCKSCNWTGVQVPHRNSLMVVGEVLVGCIFMLNHSLQTGDTQSVRDVIRWAVKYLQPNIEGVDLKAVAEETRRQAGEGQALIDKVREGPSEAVSTEEMRRRLLED